MSESQEPSIPATGTSPAENGKEFDTPPCTLEMSQAWLQKFRQTGRIPVQNTLNIRGLQKR